MLSGRTVPSLVRLNSGMTAAELHAAMKALGLSQRALASRLGVALSTVSAWATGKAPVPKYASAYLELLASTTPCGLTHPAGL